MSVGVCLGLVFYLIEIDENVTMGTFVLGFDGEWGLSMRLKGAPDYPRNAALGCIEDCNEVRIAYVLKKDDLNRALFVLQKALEAYPGREMKD